MLLVVLEERDDNGLVVGDSTGLLGLLDGLLDT